MNLFVYLAMYRAEGIDPITNAGAVFVPTVGVKSLSPAHCKVCFRQFIIFGLSLEARRHNKEYYSQG